MIEVILIITVLSRWRELWRMLELKKELRKAQTFDWRRLDTQ